MVTGERYSDVPNFSVNANIPDGVCFKYEKYNLNIK